MKQVYALNLPMGWEIKKLGDVCEISTGKSNTEDATENGEFAFFDRSKLVKRSSKFLFDCDAIIVAGEGQTFLPKYFSGKFDLHQRAYAIYNFDKSVSVHYAYKYLIHFHKYFERVAVGATAKSLRLRHFQDLPIPIPSLSEQRRIVAILDECFEAIAKAKANAEQNLRNAKELFESYLKGVFEQKGDGWETATLGDVCSLYQGIAINAKTKHVLVDKSELPLLRIKDLKNNTEEQYVDPANFPKNALINEDDIIYTRTGSLGLVFRGRKGVLHNNSFKVVPNSKIDNDFLFIWLQNPIFKSKIMELALKAAQPDITHAIFKIQEISFPTIKKQQAIVRQLNYLRAETQKLEEVYQKKLDDLGELKKSILQKAFAGELSYKTVTV